MERKDREALLTHRMSFVSDLEPTDILSHLLQDGVISENDLERVRAGQTRRERVEVLLDTIPRKGKAAFTKFANVLQQTDGYNHLAKLLAGGGPQSLAGDAVDAGTDVNNSRDRSNSNPKKLIADFPEYPMNTNPKGWCLIINNDRFVGSELPQRLGADVDGQSIQALFLGLNFKVRYMHNKNADVIQGAFQELGALDHNNMSCVVVVLMSHGMDGLIYSADSTPLQISTLIQPLIKQCPSLVGKPKLFIIQSCRVTPGDLQSQSDLPDGLAKDLVTSDIISNPLPVEKEDSQLLEDSYSDMKKWEALCDNSQGVKEADIVFAYSTFPLSVSIRNIHEGSWFIQALVEVLREYSTTEDFVSMLLRVNSLVVSRMTSQGLRQVPAPVITLTKKLYLRLK